MTEAANTQRTIGRLEGKLDALIETVRQQGERADASRSRVYERLEQMADEQTKLETRVGDIGSKVAVIEPFAAEFAAWKQRGLAVVFMLSVVWLLVGSTVVSWVKDFFAWVFKAAGHS